MTKVNVLYWYWGRKGGGANYASLLFKSLKKSKEINLFPSFSRQSDFYIHETEKDENFNIDTYVSILEFLLKTMILPLTIIRLYFFLKRNRVNDVFCPMSHLWNIFFLPMFRLAGVKYTLVVHDAVPHPGDNLFIRKHMLRYEILSCAKIIVLTNAVKEKVLENYNVKAPIEVIPHGVLTYGHQGPRNYPSSQFNLVFFGRILEYKGVDLLIQEFCKIKNANINLKIYGRGEVSKKSEFLINSSQSITFKNDWIKEEDIGEIMNSSDALILPYIEASQSGVIPIALSSGIPIIASDIGGLKEQLNNGQLGVMFKPKDRNELSQALMKLVQDKELYEKLSREGYEFCKENLSWAAIAKKVEEFIGK